MKNEIDQTVERIGQLPDDAKYGAMLHYVTKDEDGNYVANDAIVISDAKALANAYTQLKAEMKNKIDNSGEIG